MESVISLHASPLKIYFAPIRCIRRPKSAAGVGSKTSSEAEDLTNIDAIEAKTGLDFLWAVRDDVENDIEDDRHNALWSSQ